MSRITPQLGLAPSLLDRLIDAESSGTAILTGYNAEQMYQAVLRDLEALLNTRQIRDAALLADPILCDSLLTYGLPDFVSAESLSATQRAEIGTAIRKVVERFEPRLKEVRVTLLSKEGDESVKQRLRFRVAARLNVDPSPDVTFETILEMASGHYQVTETPGT
jgi:type VI secretion system protein ImpF